MLIETIKFEIRNFSNGTAEQFMVENTELNFAMIASHKLTRDIHFTKEFDFQFNAEVKYPQFMLLGEAFDAAIAENADVLEIDEVDEMVGTF